MLTHICIIGKMEVVIAKEMSGLQPSLSLKSSTTDSNSLNHSIGISASLSDESLGLMRPRSLLLSTGVGGGAEESEDAEAMLELQKIMKLKNTADWGMMTMSLKSLSRRFSRKGVEIQDLKLMMDDVSVSGMPSSASWKRERQGREVRGEESMTEQRR